MKTENWFVRMVKWIATVVEDKAGSISSKRVGFFWCLWMLNRAAVNTQINEIVIYAIVGLAFGLVGLTVPEWFSNHKKPIS
ncbi:hypothetical protein [Sunxiuqinia indica]|uniref:hypothetical protein n=1 Tax=Sunxiuqinia indica TaxID=2692584 RepID=UPI00135ACB58|nr:hypothetical protein [Sunxiuqinia indica]